MVRTDAERPSDGGHEAHRLQSRRPAAVRCSALILHSKSSTIIRDSAVLVYADESVTTWRRRTPPDQNTPRTVWLPLRCLELCSVKPCVIRSNCRTSDCEVHFVASFTSEALAESRWLPGRPPSQSIAPATPFGQARLSRSERVRVVFADDPKPLVVWFQPLRYHELHTYIVPVEVRSAPHYSHYRLALRTAPTSRWLHHESEFFTEAFRLIEDVA